MSYFIFSIIISSFIVITEFCHSINALSLLSDIEVYKETFGSDDFNILYEFIAKDYTIKNGATNLSNELIEEIEKEMYASDDSKLWEGDDN